MYKSAVIEKIYCIILIHAHVAKKFSEVIIKDNTGLILKTHTVKIKGLIKIF